MRKRWITVVVTLGLVAAFVVGLATATGAPKKTKAPTQAAAPAIAKDLGPQFGVGFTAKMTGAQDVPPGDPDGTGTAIIRLNAAEGLVCFKIVVQNVDLPIVASHIHGAPAGAA